VYGRFVGSPTVEELERFFFLDDTDRRLVARRRGDASRLGFALQLTIVRCLGTFLNDPIDVRSAVLDFVADQMGIADPSCVKTYTTREMTRFEHRWEISQAGRWQDLDADVRANGNVLRVSMWDLRHLSGKMRLKVNVVAAISGELADIGLGHLPHELPRNQNEYVVVYKIGSEAGAVINAVRNGSSSEQAERALRSLNTSKTIKIDRQNEAKIAELAAKVDELENLLKGFRDILDM